MSILENLSQFFAMRTEIDAQAAMNQATKPIEQIANPLHPYYPLESEVIGYLANEYSVLTLLGAFASGCAVIFGSTYLVVRRVRPNLPGTELATILWFVLCGCIHLFFEGYFAYNFRSMGPLQDIFGQLWKEYSLSDSRYMTKNAFVLCMETITAVFWGPLSFLVAGLITTESPYRYPFQAIVSLGQLYGDVLYYATAAFDHYLHDKQYSRPEAYYYYFYYIFMNAFWIVIPLILLSNSVRASARAFAAVNRSARLLQANGVKKAQ